MRTQQSKYVPYCMWLIPLSFFTYQFILRLWPGLMMPQIMTQFAIDASEFGILAAFYYYGYAGMQIPVAILLDRFNARVIVCIFAILCGLATLLFTYTDNFYWAIFSRFLIGAGSAVGFLGVSKVVSEWFSKENYARMIGLSFTIGLLGAIYGGKPVHKLIEAYNWQQVSFTLAIIALLLGLLAAVALRSPVTHTPTSKTEKFKLSNLLALLASPKIWLLALSNLLMVGALEGFADVWGVQYLMTAYSIEKGAAAGLVSFIFIGMLFGGPLLAFFSKRFGNYTVLVTSGVGLAALFLLLFSSPQYHWWSLACLFFVTGVLCCYQVIVFAAGATLVPPQCLGITVAFLNCINMLGGSFFHTSIGKLIDLFWTGQMDAEGSRLYDISAYQYALGAIPACALMGALLVSLLGIYIHHRSRIQ